MEFKSRLFGWWLVRQTVPPEWHSSPFRAAPPASGEARWGDATVQMPEGVDVKEYWEWSRFYWVPSLARAAASGDRAAGLRLEEWLEDWIKNNPPFRGINWTCGQEAAVRLLHLLQASLFCDELNKPRAALLWLVRIHLERIARTLHYAIGQDNNHGSSEAAALFAGGAWLQKCGCRHAAHWHDRGRRWLVERAYRLFQADGSGNQYSVTYHRVVLDTFSFVELWRRALGLNPFPDPMRERLGKAADWLRQLTDPSTGDAPNLGSNDGSHILAVREENYRDFRPSVELATTVFLQRSAYDAAEAAVRLQAYNLVQCEERLPLPASVTFDHGGLHVLRKGGATAYMRYPRFRFRPSQADALHLDLWVNGVNWLRDGGSYSYASALHNAYFSGTAAHNTVEFDERDQMPRIGRFLFGSWLKTHDVEAATSNAEGVRAAAAYQDYRGALHRRSVQLSPKGLICRDQLGGAAQKAVLRWRLRPVDWKLDGNCVRSGSFCLAVDVDDPAARIRLTEGWESRYYLKKRRLPVLEVETRVPACILTRVDF